MSPPKPEPKPEPRNLSEALFPVAAAPTPPAQLSQVEQRLVALTTELFDKVLLEVRKDDWLAAGGPAKIPEFPRSTLAQIVTAHRIALACAIEIEKPLRELRDQLEGKP